MIEHNRVWKTVPLAEVATIERRAVSAAEIKDGTLYVGLEHMDSEGGFLDIGPVHAGDLASTKFRFTPDHILYGKLRPYLAKIARPNFSGVCSTDTHVVRPDTDNPDRVRHTFCVLPRLQTSRFASDFYINTAKRLATGSPFQQF